MKTNVRMQKDKTGLWLSKSKDSILSFGATQMKPMTTEPRSINFREILANIRTSNKK